MKRFTVFAIISSLLLTLFLIYESSRVGEVSTDHSNAVSDAIKDNFDVDTGETKKPQSIKFDKSALDSTYCYSGDSVKLPLTFEPAGSNQEVVYSFSKSEGCKMEGNKFTYTGTDYTTITITATSVHNKSISAKVDVTYRGINPDDEGVERVNLYISEPSELNSQKNYSVADDAHSNISPAEMSIGKSYFIKMTLTLNEAGKAKYGISEDEISANGIPYKLECAGANVQHDVSDRQLMFYEIFDGPITVKAMRTPSKLSAASASESVNVGISYDYVPSSPLVPSIGVLSGSSYVVRVDADTESVDITSVAGTGSVNTAGKLIFADDDGAMSATLESRSKLTKTVNGCEVKLYLVSLFNPELKTPITVIFEEKLPSAVHLYGESNIPVGKSKVFSAEITEELYGKGDVRLVIVKGKNVIELDGWTVTGLKFGNAVIRAESIHYPDVYTELKITVRPWDNFSGLIRKVVGHFLAFFFLGQGYIVCWFFLIKKRWLAFIFAPASVYGIAALTEHVQKYTDGRHGSMEDVMMDFWGGMYGIGFVVLCITVFILILMRFYPESFVKLKRDLKRFSIKTVFTHIKKPEVDVRDDYMVSFRLTEKKYSNKGGKSLSSKKKSQNN